MKKLDSQQVELIGTAALEAELIRQGFEVAHPNRDRGIDLIVYTDEPSKPFSAVPIQVKASSGTGFGVFKKYEKFDRMIFAYIWNALDRPRFFIVPYQDAVALLPDAQKQTKSWLREDKDGAYSWTNVPKAIRDDLQAYENRWDLIKKALSG